MGLNMKIEYKIDDEDEHVNFIILPDNEEEKELLEELVKGLLTKSFMFEY